MTRKKVQLFNPRKQDWDEHFRWSNDGTQIIGQTSRQAQCIVVDPCSRVAVPFVSATEQVVSAAVYKCRGRSRGTGGSRPFRGRFFRNSTKHAHAGNRR